MPGLCLEDGHLHRLRQTLGDVAYLMNLAPLNGCAAIERSVNCLTQGFRAIDDEQVASRRVHAPVPSGC